MTGEPTSEDLIRYDVMVQEALLDVVRKVLQEAARHGLPGDHHFYITFRSQAPGVRLSSRLREKYPEEMTIVLQHQFWDLIVNDHNFEVGLAFGGLPERLLVPYDALTGFYDPSVQFGLKFTPDEAQADNDLGEDNAPAGLKDRPHTVTAREGSGRDQAGKDTLRQDVAAKADPGAGAARPSLPAPARAPKAEPLPKAAPMAKAEPGPGGDAPKLAPSERPGADPASKKPRGKAGGVASARTDEKPGSGAEVVSLEAFRKKK